MKKLYIIALVAVVGLSLLALGLAAAHERRVNAAGRVASPTGLSAARSAAEDNPKVIRFASNGEPMPPFLVNDLEGRLLSTAEWRGKVVIVMFWATWCPPCREEIPEMIDLANRYKDRLQIVGVSEDDDATPEEVHEFAKAAKINYPIVMGKDGISREWGG